MAYAMAAGQSGSGKSSTITRHRLHYETITYFISSSSIWPMVWPPTIISNTKSNSGGMKWKK